RTLQQTLFPKTEIGFMGVTPGSATWAAYPYPQSFMSFEGKKVVTHPHPLANLEDHEAYAREGLIDVLTVTHNSSLVEPEKIRAEINRVKGVVGNKCRFAVEI